MECGFSLNKPTFLLFFVSGLLYQEQDLSTSLETTTNASVYNTAANISTFFPSVTHGYSFSTD